MRPRPYDLSLEDAEWLKGVVTVPASIRREVITQWVAEIGADRLPGIFAEFVALAASAIDNAREMVELVLITEGGMHPHTAEKVNLPTLFGALNGIALAHGVDESKLCGGCAFRLGTPANQSPCTTIDAETTIEPGEVIFMCHEDVDARGQPTKACAGFAQARRSAKAVT